jgi:hypothetical protein
VRYNDDQILGDKLATYADAASSAFFDTDFRRGDSDKQLKENLKPLSRVMKQDAKNKVVGRLEEYVSGGAIKKPKFVKGSQEAKDYMASLRARRKTNGAGLVQHHINAIENKILGKGMVPLGGKGMVPLGGKGMVPLGGKGMVPLGGKGMVPL